MKVTINISRRPEIADPHGATVRQALHDLGYGMVKTARIDRTIHLEVDGDDPVTVTTAVAEMCTRLLANPVLEDFEVVAG
jgi:phosphoribosylformylglycinamidine synthase subunit PurS